MRVSLRPLTIGRIAAAVTALWMYGAGSASAGGGGEDAAGLNSALQALCATLGSSLLPTCPQLPPITQGVLEIAAINNAPPERVRAFNNIGQGLHVDAGNPGRPPAMDPQISTFPVVDTGQSKTLSKLLLSSPALAFISAKQQSLPTATATQLYDPDADTFLYGVTSGFLSQGVQPDTLFLFYDDTSRTNKNFVPGQVIAKVSLQLVVLASNFTETLVPTTLQIIVPKPKLPMPASGAAVDCSASTVSGNFSGNGTQTFGASQIGLDCAVVFAASPFSSRPHAIFEIEVPLVVTNATDPLYFAFQNPNSLNLGNSPFLGDETGFTPTNPHILPAGASIGIAPFAAPMGPPPANNGPTAYALCANLPGGNGNGRGGELVPSVAAFYAIATDGETRLEAPLAPTSPIVCPF
jgi:hypothetical protein